MGTKAQPVPDGFHTVTPYLIVDDAKAAISFLQNAFDAEIHGPVSTRPDGKVMNVAMKIGSSMIMLADVCEQAAATQTMLYLYVPDVDAIYRRALKAGASVIAEPTDQFYGDRSGGVMDPAGNRWFIATHIEDVAPEEMERRAAAMMQSRGTAA